MITAYFLADNTFLFWTNNHYLPVVLVFNLIWLLAANITGLYEHVLTRDSIKTYRSVIKTYLLFLSFYKFYHHYHHWVQALFYYPRISFLFAGTIWFLVEYMETDLFVHPQKRKSVAY